MFAYYFKYPKSLMNWKKKKKVISLASRKVSKVTWLRKLRRAGGAAAIVYHYSVRFSVWRIGWHFSFFHFHFHFHYSLIPRCCGVIFQHRKQKIEKNNEKSQLDFEISYRMDFKKPWRNFNENSELRIIVIGNQWRY